jgi:hypothetical protein
MNSAPLSPAAARAGRSDRLRRERADAKTLRSVFPTLQELRLDMQFQGTAANNPTPYSHLLYPPAPAFFIFPCPHADCDGQFDLTAAINAAIAAGLHRAEGELTCSGARIGDRGARQPCQLHILHTITATYHDPP